MSPIAVWILCYAALALLAVRFKTTGKSEVVHIIYVHFLLLVSVCLFAWFGVFLAWTMTPYALVALIGSITVIVAALGRLGVAYVPSCFIQEWVLLTAGPFLATVMPFFAAAIITTLLFAIAHKGPKDTWKTWSSMFFLYMVWGMITLYLYLWLHQPLYNVALHLFAGGMLAYFGVIFRNRNEVPWLMPQ